MILSEHLKKLICDEGISEVDADKVLELVWEKAKETEAKDFWDKDIDEIRTSNQKVTDEELRDAIIDVLWRCARLEIKQMLYVKMENLAELIIKFK